MRVVFLGSGAFAIPCLEALLGAGHEVAAVVTQPDKEKGRGRAVLASPAEAGGARARPHGPPAPPHQGARRAGRAARARARDPGGGRLRPDPADRPSSRSRRGGTVNVHGSLLPRYRGAAPVQWAIVNGETETGVTTMLIDEGLDTGPPCSRAPRRSGTTRRRPSWSARLADLGAELLVDTLAGLADGTVTPDAAGPRARDARADHQEGGRRHRLDPARRRDRAPRPRVPSRGRARPRRWAAAGSRSCARDRWPATRPNAGNARARRP